MAPQRNNKRPMFDTSLRGATRVYAKKKRTAQATAVIPVVGSCAKDFANLVANPFKGVGSACLPHPPTIRSKRLTVFTKGTFSSQATLATPGRGWIAASPMRAVAGDLTCLKYTSSATTSNRIEAGEVNMGTENSNSPYEEADFDGAAAGLQYRIICAGLRIRYRGRSDDKGGGQIGMVHPNHQTLHGYNYTDFQDYDNDAKSIPVSENWTQVVWTPAEPEDYQFRHDFKTEANDYPMGFHVHSALTSANVAYEYEFYSHYEIVGEQAVSQQLAHSDQVGMDSVLSAAESRGLNSAGTLSQAVVNVERSIHKSLGATTHPGRYLADAQSVLGKAGAAYKTAQGVRRGVTGLLEGVESTFTELADDTLAGMLESGAVDLIAL